MSWSEASAYRVANEEARGARLLRLCAASGIRSIILSAIDLM